MLALWAALFQLARGVLLLVSYISSDSFPQPLSPAEEKYYLEQLKKGSETARQILIEHNLRLVAHVVKKYENTGSEKEDLISIGTVGLIKAVNTFDASKNTRLATYAARCVENEVLMHIRAAKKKKKEVSLNDPIGTDNEGNEITLLDVLGTGEDEVIEKVESTLLTEKVQRIIKKLKEREQKVILMRYGLEGKKRHTQKEVASKLGISRSYVSRIEKKIICRLAEELYAEGCQQ